jgi:hypothetical protein
VPPHSGGQLGHAVRPAHQAERLDEGGGHAEHNRERAQCRWRGEGHGKDGRQREHRQGAEEQELPAKKEAWTTGGEAAQDLVRLPAQDVRVVEGPSEREERAVERYRNDDQQNPGQRLDGHDYACTTAFDARDRPEARRLRAPKRARSDARELRRAARQRTPSGEIGRQPMLIMTCLMTV